jgi:hypothetical protein
MALMQLVEGTAPAAPAPTGGDDKPAKKAKKEAAPRKEKAPAKKAAPKADKAKAEPKRRQKAVG